MSTIKTALVIGGGIAGPVAAMALRKAGVEAAVYEAYPRTADSVGGGLGLAPNGVNALDLVGAREAVLDIAIPATRQVMTMVGKEVMEFGTLPGLPPLQLVRRGDLYRVLLDRAAELGVPVHHGKRLVGADEDPSGVTARFADGTSVAADMLVGADGVHSAVRRLIDPNAPGPDYTGLLVFEAIADHQVPVEPGTVTFAFGKRAYCIYWPLPDGRTTWGMSLPREAPLPLAKIRDIPAADWLGVFRELLANDHPGHELAEHTSPDNILPIGPMYIMPGVPRWYSDRMVLVGDAVHAPSNSSGQGASLAIESGIQLARCVRDLPDAPTAFAAYESLRRDRVEKIATRAAAVNRAKAPGPVGRTLMPMIMSLMKPLMNPERMFGPVQRYTIDWSEHVAE
ncbi:FAD-dependent oxidoreductase [Streptomyces sp. NPDC059161]|uniref:FAD-dependent oxidoreductase n=1 Tax=unclassified Streptomyces TaxID=2593676 RepID=UPI003656F7A1